MIREIVNLPTVDDVFLKNELSFLIMLLFLGFLGVDMNFGTSDSIGRETCVLSAASVSLFCFMTFFEAAIFRLRVL
jgi:hypothetical protein